MAAAILGRKQGLAAMASNLVRSVLTRPSSSSSNLVGSGRRSLTAGGAVTSEIITTHTQKWMQDTTQKSPMQLINEVPPIKVEGRIVACEGDSNPALGHPIEFICLDKEEPAVCKYCGLRYVQDHGSHHH
ncbi:NADH dehydrogenase [ubiquinone] iron-sulfur protein 6, mitochondrial [Coffea eugenioides]|uniref:NADH dehydrogenase [ubiquinone] iron-sulfur protein 6, mitochondrial-like n=1 Tax=Coffea arabica TaxID=13443 RepID=A0ABM4WQJ3_COFAR|nr:NADH dehydrogenase [ubiquinone] iron-sulfur protein 6, mitochondrial [Coffea eugenioides]